MYRQGDPNKTEMIAKDIREGSREPDIFHFLRMTGSQSPHVILPIETVISATRKGLILPKMCSIDQQFMDDGGPSARTKLGWGLIKGLAYLHEHKLAHRDIKPDNLVCDKNYSLQIIDFDVAIKVQDENTEIDKYRGTEGWTAPEMGKPDGPTPMYSPIKADRWSCGHVLVQHIMVGEGNNSLSKFASQLMACDPRQRPSLLDWRKWHAGSSYEADVPGETSKPRQDMMKVDKEVDMGEVEVDTVEVEVDMEELPSAKKPRLELDNEQQVIQNYSAGQSNLTNLVTASTLGFGKKNNAAIVFRIARLV